MKKWQPEFFVAVEGDFDDFWVFQYFVVSNLFHKFQFIVCCIVEVDAEFWFCHFEEKRTFSKELKKRAQEIDVESSLSLVEV